MRHGWSVIILQIQPVRYDSRQSLAQDCQGKQWKEKKARISEESQMNIESREMDGNLWQSMMLCGGHIT